MSVKEKATAPVSSVGADGKQPLCKNNKESIADLPQKGNLQAANNRGSGAEVTASTETMFLTGITRWIACTISTIQSGNSTMASMRMTVLMLISRIVTYVYANVFTAEYPRRVAVDLNYDDGAVVGNAL